MICYVITIMRVSMEYLYLWHSISRQAQLIVSYIGSIWFQIKKCIFPFKSEGYFLILTEECLTFKAISFCRAPRLLSFLHTFVRPDHVHDGEGAQRLRSFLCPRVFLSLFEYFKGALQTSVYDVFQYFCFRPCYCFIGYVNDFWPSWHMSVLVLLL